MKISKYTICLPNFPKKGKSLILNLFNGKVVVVSDVLLNKSIQDLKKISPFFYENFFVPSDKADRGRINDYFSGIISSKKKIGLSILTTTDCNMQCPYCHEGLKKKSSYLSDTMANKIVDFISEQLVTDETENVDLYFYGGEPLLNIKPIEIITSKLKTNTQISVSACLSTNGIDLTKEKAQYLYNNGITSVQVTIDGPEEVHNRRRKIKGINSFVTICNNILDVKGILDVVIRINIDKDNIDSIPDLLNFLVSNKLSEGVSIYCDFVTKITKENKGWNNNILESTEELLKIIDIWNYFRYYAIPLKGLKLIEGPCGALGSNNLTIDPSGDIYDCIGFVGEAEWIISNIQNDIEILDKYYSKRTNVWKDCLDCKFVPICAGGCRVQAYIETKSTSSKHCRKDFLSRAYPEFLKIKYHNV
jgi:uncharacterized protein